MGIKQFIVELKIWQGSEYNELGRRQLAEYLEYYNQEKGYLLARRLLKQWFKGEEMKKI